MAIFQDSAHADSELSMAVAALVQAMTLYTVRILLRRLRTNADQLVMLPHRAAVMADRTMRPKHTLDVFESCGFVAEVRAGQDGHGGRFLGCRKFVPSMFWFVNGIIAESAGKMEY